MENISKINLQINRKELICDLSQSMKFSQKIASARAKTERITNLTITQWLKSSIGQELHK